MSPSPTLAHTLYDSLIYELTKALALPQSPSVHRVIQRVFGKAARAYAELAVTLDGIVESSGLNGGARWLLPRFVKSHEAQNVEGIPAEGPLLIAANHPGSIDSIVVTAHVQRPDYKIIAGDIPFFKSLPHVSQRAIYTPEEKDAPGRIGAVRESVRHLRSGGALLIFPRGYIETDPDLSPSGDPIQFQLWSRSLEFFHESVPQLQLLVTIVSGVISRRAMRHPITWFRRARPDRQRLAFLYQFVRQILSGKELFGLTPRVTFGELITGGEHSIAEIGDIARRTLSQHMARI